MVHIQRFVIERVIHHSANGTCTNILFIKVCHSTICVYIKQNITKILSNGLRLRDEYILSNFASKRSMNYDKLVSLLSILTTHEMYQHLKSFIILMKKKSKGDFINMVYLFIKHMVLSI